MPLIKVNSAKDIQPALNSLASDGAAANPAVVVLEDGNTYCADVIVPPGVTLRGGAPSSTLLVGSVRLQGSYLEQVRIAGSIVAETRPNFGWLIDRVVASNMAIGGGPVLVVEHGVAGGTGGYVTGNTVLTSFGSCAVMFDPAPPNFTGGVMEYSFACRAIESYNAALGALIDVGSPVAMRVTFWHTLFQVQSPLVDFVRAKNQCVKMYGCVFDTYDDQFPKIRAEENGSIRLSKPMRVTPSSQFVGNVVITD